MTNTATASSARGKAADPGCPFRRARSLRRRENGVGHVRPPQGLSRAGMNIRTSFARVWPTLTGGPPRFPPPLRQYRGALAQSSVKNSLESTRVAMTATEMDREAFSTFRPCRNLFPADRRPFKFSRLRRRTTIVTRPPLLRFETGARCPRLAVDLKLITKSRFVFFQLYLNI